MKLINIRLKGYSYRYFIISLLQVIYISSCQSATCYLDEHIGVKSSIIGVKSSIIRSKRNVVVVKENDSKSKKTYKLTQSQADDLERMNEDKHRAAQIKIWIDSGSLKPKKPSCVSRLIECTKLLLGTKHGLCILGTTIFSLVCWGLTLYTVETYCSPGLFGRSCITYMEGGCIDNANTNGIRDSMCARLKNDRDALLSRNTQGATLISEAAVHGDPGALFVLLRHAEDNNRLPQLVNSADRDGNTALHYAVWSGKTDSVSILLRNCIGTEIDLPNNQGDTPLLLAVQGKQYDVVKSLIKSKASPFLRNKQGDNAISLASGDLYMHCLLVKAASICEPLLSYTAPQKKPDKGNKDNASPLIETNACEDILPNSAPNYSLVEAITKDDMSRVCAFVKAQHSMTPESGGLAMMAALTKADPTYLEVLLKYYGNQFKDYVDQYENTLTMKAIMENNVVGLSGLVNYDAANVERENLAGETPLTYAASRNMLTIVQRLLSNYLPIINQHNNQGYTALMLSIQHGYDALTKYLLGLPRIHARQIGVDGNTALTLAITRGNHDLSVYLLEKYDAPVNSLLTALPQMTVLQMAVEQGDIDLSTRLLKRGAEILQNDLISNKLLIYAAQNNDTLLFRLLLDQLYININIQDEKGMTPLMWAAKHNNAVVVNHLLTRRADPRVQTSLGMTALGIATDDYVINLIKNAIN